MPSQQVLRRRAEVQAQRTTARQRQLLFSLERHPMEALPLTQLFILMAKATARWWNSNEGDRGPPVGGGAGAGGDQSTEGDTQFDGISMLIPDTVVWENNIPKGWFYYDDKERTVQRRKVETKQLQQVFLADAMYANDVVAVLYGHAEDDEGEFVNYRYLTAGELPEFLFEIRDGKGTCMLQRFTYSLAVQRVDTIQATWTPTVQQYTRRQNTHELFDERVDVSERCCTFDGPTHLSAQVQCTTRVRDFVKRRCEMLAQHFRDVDGKHQLTRMILHFRVNENSKLVLLYCSSARVLPLQSSATNATVGAVTGGSLFHRRFRVSLDMATRYRKKPLPRDATVEIPAAVSDVTSLSGSRSSPYAQRTSASRASTSAAAPTVEGTDATRVGFLMRQRRTLDSQAEIRSSRRGATASTSVTVRALLREVRRVEGVESEASARAAKMLDACVRKVGNEGARAAYLAVGQELESGLTDAEKAELLMLRLRYQKLSRLSRARGTSPQPILSQTRSTPSRKAPMGSGSDMEATKTVLNDIVYMAQQHFELHPLDEYVITADINAGGPELRFIEAAQRYLTSTGTPSAVVSETSSRLYVVAPPEFVPSDGTHCLLGSCYMASHRLLRLAVAPQARAAQKLMHISRVLMDEMKEILLRGEEGVAAGRRETRDDEDDDTEVPSSRLPSSRPPSDIEIIPADVVVKREESSRASTERDSENSPPRSAEGSIHSTPQRQRSHSPLEESQAYTNDFEASVDVE